MAYEDWAITLTSTSAFSTIVLVCVTAYYAYQTKKTVEQMEKARRQQVLPVLKASLIFPGPAIIYLRIQNIGLGPAININATIKIEPGSHSHEWLAPILNKDEYRKFLLPLSSFEEILATYERIIITGSFGDIFGTKHQIIENLDVKKLLNSLKTQPITELWIDPYPLKALDKINDNLKKIADNLK